MEELIRSHRDVLVGVDFFTTEVLTLKGLTTYYVRFFTHLETRQVNLAGFTPYPDQEWIEQQARNITMEEWGCLKGCRYLLHDRDAKFCPRKKRCWSVWKRLIRWCSTATSMCRSEFFRRVKRPNLFSRLGVIGVFRKPGCAAMAVSPTSASVQARQLSSLF